MGSRRHRLRTDVSSTSDLRYKILATAEIAVQWTFPCNCQTSAPSRKWSFIDARLGSTDVGPRYHYAHFECEAASRCVPTLSIDLRLTYPRSSDIAKSRVIFVHRIPRRRIGEQPPDCRRWFHIKTTFKKNGVDVKCKLRIGVVERRGFFI